MKLFTILDPQRRHSLLILFVSGVFFWCSITTLLGTLPLYVESVGASKQQIGFVMGGFAIGLLLSRVVLGRVADARSRKLVLLVGTFVVAIGPLGYMLTTSVPLLMVVRVFHGISIAAFTTGYSALVTDLSPEGRRGELIGLMSLIAPIGMGLGPALGSFLQEARGYIPLFFTSSGLGILAFAGIFFVWEPSRLQEKKAEVEQSLESLSEESRPLNFWQILMSRPILVPAVTMLMVGLVFGTIISFLPLFIRETGIDISPGWFFIGVAIASIGVRLPAGPASDRYGRAMFLSMGLVGYLLCVVTLWNANSGIAIVLAGFCQGAGAGMVLPMVIALIADRSPLNARAQFFSICLGGFDMGMAIAGPVFGSIAEVVGYRNMFAIDALLASVAIAVFTTSCNKNFPSSVKFVFGRAKDAYAIEHI